MNKRIKSLVYEAEKYALNKANDHDGDEDYENTFEDDFQEKFAELLIRECAEIADKSNQGSKSSNEGTEFYYNADIGDKIKEHFGVEE